MSEERVVKRNIKRPSRKKVCNFCVDKVTEIDYKDTNKLKKYITETCSSLQVLITESLYLILKII